MPITPEYISDFISRLQRRYPHAGNFCYFTDITNLAGIFSVGRLLCRNEAIRRDLIQCDCASSDVLSGTHEGVLDRVRLYFAPDTPMLFRVEGIKRLRDEWPECPQPVYFVFDPNILTLPNVIVSDGNMRSVSTIHRRVTREFIQGLPYERIYHRGSFLAGGDEIIRSRHAEVLVPRELSLEHLRRIVFRTSVERELAAFMVSNFPDGVQVEVDKTWFSADRITQERQARLYPEALPEGRNGIAIANVQPGDVIHIVGQSGDGVRAIERVYGNGRWGPTQNLTIEPDHPYRIVEPGWWHYYIGVRRIAVTAM